MIYTDPVKYESDHKKQGYLFCHWYPIIMKEIAEHCKDKVVVDLGCGTGIYTIPTMEYAKEVIGIDSSKQMLDYANGKSDKAKWVLGDAHKIPLEDNSVDTVLCIGILEYIDRFVVLREVNRILKNQGKAILVCPNKYSAERLPYKIFCKIAHKKYSCNEPSYIEMINLIKRSGFQIIKTVMNDGLIWLPKRLDRLIGDKIYALVEGIFSIFGANPFSNVMMFVVEKT